MEEKEKRNSGFWTGFLTAMIIVCFIVCILLCIKIFVRAVGGNGNAKNDRLLEDAEVKQKVNELEDIIDRDFIDSVSDDQLSEGMYRGIMEALDDPYAEYYNTEEWIEMQNDTEGIYFGIGAYLMKDLEYLYPRVTGIIDNTPAQEAGLKTDDIIVEVEGEEVYDMSLTDVVNRIRGEEGTKVHLKIIRGADTADREELEFDVERRKVETPTVTSEMKDNNIGYIRISEFDTVTVDQFAEALAEVKGKNATGLIIDLRDNPGGSLKSVVDIAGMLLPAGKVVYTEDKYGRQDVYECDGKHEINIPMAVLVNGNSASASEILAGAIKDYKKGTLIGTTTFGKGIVQRIFELKDDSAVKLTVSHYYTPNGNDIHKVGITPDVELEFDREAYEKDETDNQLQKAIEILSE
ncbi:MAG: S41 family peptidase [Lachnospiraceae bacterium]|nr:S41 family peptidase [Lachnospiraceae bacterium]